MQTGRRLGAARSETRALLLDTAADIMRQEGSAAVTARRLADKIGLQRHIVHYYFGTVEDLFLALIQRDGANTRAWLAGALLDDDPLQVIWQLGKSAAAQTLEFAALANRHTALREEFKRHSEEFRRSLTQALERHLQRRGLTPALPPVAITLALQSIAYSLSIETLFDIREGHDAMHEFMRTGLSLLVEEPAAPPSRSTPSLKSSRDTVTSINPQEQSHAGYH